MSVLVDSLRQDRTKASAIFMQFTRIYKKDNLAMFCFFEGEDSKYYGIRIRNIARPPKQPYYFNCDGKSGVLGVYRILSNRKRYEKAKAAYFIDRDFDKSIYNRLNFQSSKPIYETPCYSIENFYTSVSCVSEILRSEFNLNETNEEEIFIKCINLYQKLQTELHAQVGLLNAYIACLKEKQVKLNLNNYNISDFVKINLAKITSTYTLTTLNKKFSHSITLSQDELNAQLSLLQSLECQKSFRGKFEIDFLCKFLEQLKEKANIGDKRYFSKKYKVTFNFSRKTIISDLSQYADTPDCLMHYLESFRDSVS